MLCVIYSVPSEKAVITHNAMRNKKLRWNPPSCVLLSVESCSLISILHCVLKENSQISRDKAVATVHG